VLRVLGTDQIVTLLAETLQREAPGGMLTRDGTRRPGQPRRAFQGLPPGPTWAEVSTILETLATTPAGEARPMKVTLIGRSGHVEVEGQAVAFQMQGKSPGPLLRGLPLVSTTPPLPRNVIVALRQWKRVKDCLTTPPDDQLIIEGYPLMQGSQPVLLAQSCVSMLQQRAQKQAQQQRQAETP
jgi:hypothetical protein